MGGLLKTFDLVPADAVMILVGAVFFVILWKILEHSLFKPYLQLIDMREAATTGAGHTAHEKLAKADELNRQFDSKLLEQRVIFMQAKLAALDRAKSEGDQLIENANKSAQDKIAANRKVIAAKLLEIQAASEREASVLTEMIISKLTSSKGFSGEEHR